jgi:hypothetical protein
MDIFSEKCLKETFLPEKPVFNLPAGFVNKTWFLSSPESK